MSFCIWFRLFLHAAGRGLGSLCNAARARLPGRRGVPAIDPGLGVEGVLQSPGRRVPVDVRALARGAVKLLGDPVFKGLTFVGGFGMAGFNAMQISLPLQATPALIRVRVLGIVTFAIGAAPFGFLHAGLLAEWLGAVNAQRLIAAEGLAAAALVLWLWPEMLKREPPRPLPD